MKPLRIALTKGRLEKQAVELLTQAGIDCSMLADKKRKLIFQSEQQPVSFFLVKAVDVLTYVKHGAADIGIVGRDILLESSSSYYEMLDLEIGKCSFCLASTPDFDPTDYRRKTIATKYPNITAQYFREKGQDVEIIKIEGSVEIAPLLGLADAIVDIVETGATLHDNGLVIYEEMYPISARLIVGKAALKQKKVQIFNLIDELEQVIKEGVRK
ncbi:ATP phosphoribosyltransferase [Listeria costaricensis]|uniref:ATP phosphoribosyltransferase n=1 Tax=Listeria costaricensis TaxID=2026604 RepID=UPI000C07929F|nr:ATP phosphoribosyltransferase [Listeria costaricensis]